eukprot:309882_1
MNIKLQQRNINYEAILKQYFDDLLLPHVHRARNKKKKKKKRAKMHTNASSILNKTNCSVIVMNALRRELHEVDDNDDGKVDCAEFVEALSSLKSCISPRTVQSKLFCDESELSIAQWMNQVE